MRKGKTKARPAQAKQAHLAVRIPEELHRQAKAQAAAERISLAALVAKALKNHLPHHVVVYVSKQPVQRDQKVTVVRVKE